MAIAAPVIGVVAFFLIWQFGVKVFDIKKYVLPRPSDILSSINGDKSFYIRNARTTMWEAFLGFAIAFVLALVAATVIAHSRFIERAVLPLSFGLIYTSKSFAAEHPTAVEDFTRAALHGMEDAIADPAGAVAILVKAIDAAGNQNYLTEQGELFRWKAELAVVQESTPTGEPVGLIDPAVFDNEYAAYVAAGGWPDGAPTDAKYYDAALAKSLYGADGKVIWPAS